jgi:N4-(beta-N-acetylglucosaminyl)-L-asparaginase
MDRRKFILQGSVVSAGLFMDSKIGISQKMYDNPENANYPLVISTWDFGLNANAAAWKLLSLGRRALDAVEEGIRVIEADPDNMSVGIGGLPDRDGIVTLV